jgi:hypothetical protein
VAKKTTISQLNIAITADSRGMRQGLSRAQTQMRGFRSRAAATFRTAAAGAAALTAAIAAIGFAAKKAFVEIVKVSTAMEDAEITASRLNLGQTELIALRSEAERAGASASTLDMALQRLVRRVSEAAQGTGEAVGALKELGLDAGALSRLRTGQIVERIARAMGEVRNQGDRVRLMMKLVDSEGVSLLRTFEEIDQKGIAGAVQRAEELGLVLNSYDLSNLQRVREETNDLADAWQGVKNQLAAVGAEFATVSGITSLLTNFAEGIRFLRGELPPVSNEFGKIAKLVKGIKDDTGEAATSIVDTAAEISEKVEEINESRIEDLRDRLQRIKDDVIEFREEATGGFGMRTQSGLSQINQAIRNRREQFQENRRIEAERAKRDAERADLLRQIRDELVRTGRREPVIVKETAIIG